MRYVIDRQTIPVILLVSLVFLAGCQAHDAVADEKFRELVGPTLNERVLLVTDKQQYSVGETIIYGVANKTDQTIWLKDVLADLSVYRYDEISGGWQKIELIPHTVGNPKPIEIPPNTDALADFGTVSTRNWGSQFKTTGKVRLLIHCSTDPHQPERVDYSAYKDVEIVVP